MIRRLASKTFVFRSFVAGLLFSLLVIPAAVLAERSVNTSTSLRTLDTSSEETRRTNKRPVAKPSVGLKVISDKNPHGVSGNIQRIVLEEKEKSTRRGGDPVFTNRSSQQAMQSNCAGELKVTVLAKEINYGMNGPEVDVRVDYAVNGVVQGELFNGQNVVVGAMDSVPLGDPGDEISFIGKSAYPSFENPSLVNYVISSTDANNSLILLDEDNLAQQVDSKGANGPFGDQLKINEILEPLGYYSEEHIVLPETDHLILFELGTEYQGSAAFDLQDLVLHVEHDCGVGQGHIYTELNYIDPFGNNCPAQPGEPATCTNGIGGVTSQKSPSGNGYSSPATAWTQSNTGNLESLRVIVMGYESFPHKTGPYTEFADFDQFDYQLEIWNGFSSYQQSPGQGDFIVSDIWPPSSHVKKGKNLWGDPTFEWIFDFSDHEPAIEFQEGQQYILMLRAIGHFYVGQVVRSGSAWPGGPDVMATNAEAGNYMDQSPWNFNNPRMGTEIKVKIP